jgi:hypothetical protein
MGFNFEAAYPSATADGSDKSLRNGN